MAKKKIKHGTGIEWTHGKGYKGETWNPVTGCSKVSPGCANCYAESLTKRFPGAFYPDSTFLPWIPANTKHNLVLHPERLDQPLRWSNPRMVFVNSMSDLFHEELPFGFIEQVFEVMAKADRHIFQILTKRAERMLSLAPDLPWPENVWMGVSIENRRFVSRADALRGVPAAVRFISAEPLLGPLIRTGPGHPDLDLTDIDWLILGGESGPGYRPLDLAWMRDLRDEAANTGTSLFVKQLGGMRPGTDLKDLPPDLRFRDMPR